MTARELIQHLMALPETLKDRPVVFVEPYDTDPQTFEIANLYTPEDESRIELGE